MATNVRGELDPDDADHEGDRAPRTAEDDRTETDPELAVTLHLRASPPTAAARRQQAVLDRVRDLDDRADVPDVAVERWGGQVTVPADAADRDDVDAVALYEEFAAAVERAGGRLEPFFEVRETAGGLLSAGPPTERTIVFPVVCLAVRRDGDVTGLYPCWKGGYHYSVEDGLAALATGDGLENL